VTLSESDCCFENNGLPNELQGEVLLPEQISVVSGWKKGMKGLKTNGEC